MPSFRLITFGCKVNQCDTAGMARELTLRGWRAAAPEEIPDLIVVNTCTVTARADQQARQTVRRLAREYPAAPLWVTGCYVQRASVEVAALPGVQAVFGNREKGRLAHLLSEYPRRLVVEAAPGAPGPPGWTDCLTPPALPDSPSPLRGEGWGGGETGNSLPSGPGLLQAEVAALPGVQAVFGNWEKVDLAPILNNYSGDLRLEADSPSPLRGEGRGGGETPQPPCLAAGKPGPGLWVGEFSAAPPFRPWPVHAVPGHTRAWLKIQEGCSHHCRYCIVPKVRGPRRSLDPAAVLAAFHKLAALGYREVVLTGVDLGQYGLDHQPPSSLAALVRQLTKKPFRVRLSSLEPQMVTLELLDALAAWPDFCPHFHLPLQSGAAPVLAAMGRPYGPGEFRDLVREISRRFPGAGLGLDVLVGFPGESAADFEATFSLVAALPVTYLHVFPYSPRPGTAAAALDPLPGKIVQARARIMRELGQAKKTEFLEAQLGQVREVLVEGVEARPGWLKGLSDHYLRVTFPGPPAWHNRLLKVRLLARQGEVLTGEAVDEP